MVCYLPLCSCTLLSHWLVDRGTLMRFEVAIGLTALFRLMPAFIALFMQVETVCIVPRICACNQGLPAEATFLRVNLMVMRWLTC